VVGWPAHADKKRDDGRSGTGKETMAGGRGGGDRRASARRVRLQQLRPAENVQVLVQALDASGAVIDQRLAWVPGGVPQLSRASFEVPRLPVADHYRVTVWSFDFVETPGRRIP
jgi:hypothetical protein